MGRYARALCSASVRRPFMLVRGSGGVRDLSIPFKTLWLCAAIAALAQPVTADLVVSVQGPHGESELSIEPGDPLDLVVVVEGPPSDTFASFAIGVAVSNSGLPVLDYSLGSDFDGGFDFSDLSNPAVLLFEGVTAIGNMAEPGHLLSIKLDTAESVIGSRYEFEIRPDFFETDLFNPKRGIPGPVFALEIVPEPMSVMLLGVGGLVAIRRRGNESRAGHKLAG